MARKLDVIIEQDADGWYVGSVPALHGCHTQARSLDELRERILEAIQLCLEVEDGEEQRSEDLSLGFLAVGRSGRGDIADYHEETLFADLDPHEA